jgi:hypothetical protein
VDGRKRLWTVDWRKAGDRISSALCLCKEYLCQARWHTPAIPALRRLRQEDFEFMASLGYIPVSKQQQQKYHTNKKKEHHHS